MESFNRWKFESPYRAPQQSKCAYSDRVGGVRYSFDVFDLSEKQPSLMTLVVAVKIAEVAVCATLFKRIRVVMASSGILASKTGQWHLIMIAEARVLPGANPVGLQFSKLKRVWTNALLIILVNHAINS